MFHQRRHHRRRLSLTAGRAAGPGRPTDARGHRPGSCYSPDHDAAHGEYAAVGGWRGRHWGWKATLEIPPRRPMQCITPCSTRLVVPEIERVGGTAAPTIQVNQGSHHVERHPVSWGDET